MQKQVIILFGPPGAGKGTQAELLSDKTGYYHFESSKVIEACFKNESPEKVFEIEGQAYKVEDEKKRWEAGLLNSPPLVVFLMVERIKELAEDDKSIIFSGSPRTVYEAEREIPLFEELYGAENTRFILLNITAETTIFRNSHRKICELMRHSILYTKETENLTTCPIDGSKLIRREGLDDPETIKVRLKEYAERTEPIFDYFEKHGLKIEKINGEQSVADVYKDVLEAIEATETRPPQKL